MPSNDSLNPEEKSLLLSLARSALEAVVHTGRLPASLPELTLQQLPSRLQEPGATFVTLLRNGELRGCIGALQACLPLAEDARQHAAAAGAQDYRFPRVSSPELAEIRIEISRLSALRTLEYECPEDLLAHLRPGVDGVLLQDGAYRATFLPQVWKKLPDPACFLGSLCGKMGAREDLWRLRKIQVQTYQVEEFREGEY